MEAVDQQLLIQLAERVLLRSACSHDCRAFAAASRRPRTTSRLASMSSTIQLKNLEERQQRLLDAIKTGTIEHDDLTQRPAQQYKVAREALLIELAMVRRVPSLLGLERIKSSLVEALGKVLRQSCWPTTRRWPSAISSCWWRKSG